MVPDNKSTCVGTQSPKYLEMDQGHISLSGCTKEFTTLRSMQKLLMLKARYGLSDADFDAFLSIIADMLPKENKVQKN
jgi:hypothetical protein